MIVVTKNADETKKLGAELAAELKSGDILALYGELGAGKTTLVQGLAQGLGVKETITSPTFILLSIYKIKSKIKNLKSKIKYFVHVDAYRLKNAREALDVGLTDHLGRQDTVVVIEWAEKLEEILKNYQIKKIAIKAISKNQRQITF